MGFRFWVLGSRCLRLCHSCPCHQVLLPEPICENLEPSFCFSDCAIGAQWLRKSLADSGLTEGDCETTDQELGMDRKGDALAMMERDVGIIEPMSGKECVVVQSHAG